MSGSIPNGGLQIRSTVHGDGSLEIELANVPVTAPEADQLVVQVEAAPINPSDMMPLLAGADPAQAEFGGTPDRPKISAKLPPSVAQAAVGRVGHTLPIGLEGAGTVVAAGEKASELVGKQVAFLSLGMGSLGQYCTVSMNECMPLPEGVSTAEGADLFCNPMTVLAMVETLHQTGQKAVIHTAAASNLGQMLVKVCREDGIPLVNIVRRQEQAELLRSIGAAYVCNASAPTFADDLAQAVAISGATVAFDAIGGGTMASQLLVAMEKAAAGRMPAYSPYGSSEMKRVYMYGHLDPSPTILPRESSGMLWSVEGWAMPPILERAGTERAAQLARRVVDNLTTTFASHYGMEVSLSGALQREAMLAYCSLTTGRKCLVRPWS